MKTRLRPALALVLCAVLCICLFPAAFAEEEASALPDIAAIQNQVVFSDPVASAAMEESDFTELSVSDEASFLAPVSEGIFKVPASATEIDAEAFAGCVGMKSVTIPAGVKKIGARAFAGCNNLIQVQFGGTVAQWKAIRIGANNEPLYRAVIFTADGDFLVPIIADVFPDDIFRSFVALNIDDGDGYLNRKEINGVSMINCAGTADNPGHIQSLRGIELFANLEKLYCTYNELSALDLTKNTKLRLLVCSHNSLSALDLSKNTALEEVYAHYNYLTALNTEKNTKLTGLYVAYNALKALDLSKNTSLSALEVLGNSITSLDLRANAALEKVYCGNNSVLSSLRVESTKLKTLDCHGNSLTSLDISKTTALEQLDCSNNLLTTLNITKCPKLQNVVNTVTPRTVNGIIYYYVNASSPYLIFDDFGASTAYGVPITSQNFPDSYFRNGILELYDKNKDGYLSTAEARAVKNMYLVAKGITTLKGIEYFTSLVNLRCYSNPLTALDVSTLKELKVLDIRGTNISTLNVSNNVYLRGLIVNTTPVPDGATVKYSYGNDYLLWYNYDVRIYY